MLITYNVDVTVIDLQAQSHPPVHDAAEHADLFRGIQLRKHLLVGE